MYSSGGLSTINGWLLGARSDRRILGEQPEKFCLGSLHRRFVSMHDVPR